MSNLEKGNTETESAPLLEQSGVQQQLKVWGEQIYYKEQKQGCNNRRKYNNTVKATNILLLMFISFRTIIWTFKMHQTLQTNRLILRENVKYPEVQNKGI